MVERETGTQKGKTIMATTRIEAVAQLIYANILPQLRFGDIDTLAAARKANDEGWTLEESAPFGNVLRIEGVHLSERDLIAAHALAESF